MPPLWFAPLNDPMKLLVFSMLFGVIHLFVGLGIKGYMELKDGKILDFFCDVVLWYVFLMGLILMLLPSEIFRSISQMEIVVPALYEHAGQGAGHCGSGRTSAHVRTGQQKSGAQAGPWRLRYLQYHRMAQRRAVLLPSPGAGTCHGRYCFRGQPDGKHDGKERIRCAFVHRGLYRGHTP